MTDTLMGEQTRATQAATAGAAPETNGAAPGARTAVPATADTAPPSARLDKAGRPRAATGGVSTAGAAASGSPGQEAAPRAVWVGRLLVAVALVAMPLVGIIGFAASYTTLRRVAADVGFGDNGVFSLAPWIPIGIDGAIVGLLAFDLVMVKRGKPWPLLRFAAHFMTAVTVLANASYGIDRAPGAGLWESLWAHPVSVGLHAVLPVLFVLGVEGARKLLIHAARIEDGLGSDSIPLHRWFLSPLATPRMYRRMRLANIRSYPEMVERERALEGYRVWLTQELGGDLSKASEEQLLPFAMAPQGYTVEEALALPAKWRQEAAERQRQEAERQRREKRRQAELEKQERIQAMLDESEIEETRHQITAKTGAAAAQAAAATAQAEAAAEAARVKAEHTRRAAERRARAEDEALQSAEEAAARRRAAEDEEIAARKEADAAAARLEAAKKAEEAEHREKEADRIRNERIADRDRAARQERDAIEIERQNTLARLKVAELEARAQKAEDYARLTPRERNERRVARMIQLAGGDMDAVPLKDIQEALSIGRTAASDVRIAAAELLKAGYEPDAVLDGDHRA